MDPIEKAIRAALEKGNPEDRVFRQRIYTSAHSALMRSLSANANMDESAKQVRLQHLARTVRSIESEFTPATAPAVAGDRRPPVSPLPQRQPQRQQDPHFEQAPAVQPPRNSTSGHGDLDTPQPYVRSGDIPASNEEQDKSSASLFRRLVTVFVVLTLLALIIMFGWAVWNSSLFGNGANSNDGPAKLSQSSANGETAPLPVGSGSAEDENWITVFEPRDAASVQASDGLSAELRGAGPGSYLVISNTKTGTQGEATFEIGKGILETLRGKKIVFNIRAKTTDGATTQMAVSCSLAGLAECQRVRFRLDGQMTENLVIVQLDDTSPEASGTLSMQPDIDHTGNPVEIVGILVRAEQ